MVGHFIDIYIIIICMVFVVFIYGQNSTHGMVGHFIDIYIIIICMVFVWYLLYFYMVFVWYLYGICGISMVFVWYFWYVMVFGGICVVLV